MVSTEKEKESMNECMPFWKALVMMFGGIACWVLGSWLGDLVNRRRDKKDD